MKHARKLASLLLALVMVFALATTAFAEGTNTITVKNAVKDQTYKLYKMLDLIVNDAHTAYSYTVNSDWTDFFKAAEGDTPAGKGRDYVNIDEQGYVTWKTTEGGVISLDDVAAFAKDAEAFAKSKNLIALKTNTPTENETFTFSGLDDGYYLVTSTLGTKATVGTTPSEPDPEIQEKNQVPSNAKTVQEDSKVGVDGQEPWGSTNDADIGQTVNFKSTITAQPGAENYVFHDQMSTGLTYKNDAKVYIDENMRQELAAVNYTVTTSPGDGDTFDITFKQNYLNTINAETKLYVKYTATLNENAVIAGEGNSNTSKLSYGDSTNTKYTPSSETKTYTWDVDVFKYTKNANNKEVALSGAKFKLSKDENGSLTISLVDITATNATTKTYRVAKTGETGTVTEITTDATGKFTIKGLDADTYYLTETAAPAGYNKLVAPIKVTIDHEGNVKYATKTTAVGQYGTEATADTRLGIKVLNQSGTLLPSTGGMGTTIFYVLGSILAVGAIVLLVTKKRMSAAD